jgi:hypothetical protein
MKSRSSSTRPIDPRLDAHAEYIHPRPVLTRSQETNTTTRGIQTGGGFGSGKSQTPTLTAIANADVAAYAIVSFGRRLVTDGAGPGEAGARAASS